MRVRASDRAQRRYGRQATRIGWDSYASAGAVSWECNVVNVAHKLADFTLHEPCMLTRELLMLDTAYLDLGVAARDADRLFDSTAQINAELDRYLSP